MWPQQQGCGNGTAHVPVCVARKCFNVAAAARLRKYWWQKRAPAVAVPLQCGRSSKAAEISGRALSALTFHLASMWPQQQGCGNREAIHSFVATLLLLQCGRSSKAAEILPEFEPRAIAHEASMWPQQQGCGNAARRPPASPRGPRFNVAAAARLRKFRLPRNTTRLYTSFNVAAAARLRKYSFPLSLLLTKERFNVAAAARLRKCVGRNDEGHRRVGASMWLQQQGCGNRASLISLIAASVELQCGRSSKAAEMSSPTLTQPTMR